MDKPEQFVPLAPFIEYMAQQTETTQMLIELISGFMTVWISTLPPAVKTQVTATNLQENIQNVREGVAKLRALILKSDPEDSGGTIQ
jgi:hypothetical protein